jgi:IclR family transcriptional regulator, acetate operon repressor
MAMIELLNAIEQDGRPMSAAEIVAATGLPRSSVFRDLKELAAAGYLRQDSQTRRYMAGPKILRLGTLAREQLGREEFLGAPLLKLARQTGETVSFSVLDVPYRVATVAIEPPDELRHVVQIGSRYPLPIGAAGKVILSALGKDLVSGILDWFGASESEARRLRAEFEEINRRGYAATTGERLSGISGMAVAVYVGDRIHGSIAVAGPTDRMRTVTKTALVHLRKAAAAVSALLSESGETPPLREAD